MLVPFISFGIIVKFGILCFCLAARSSSLVWKCLFARCVRYIYKVSAEAKQDNRVTTQVFYRREIMDYVMFTPGR